MKHVLLVFLGGGLGSALRFGISIYLNPLITNFYLGTFSVNIIGSLLIGIFLGILPGGTSLNSSTSLLLVTGFCGGFTTFSAFTYEGQALLKSGAFMSFAIYTLSSIILGILAVILGLWLGRQL